MAPSPEVDRAVVPRHCSSCDGHVRLHIRHRTPEPNVRTWNCPLCGALNTIVGRWRFMQVERLERRRTVRSS